MFVILMEISFSNPVDAYVYSGGLSEGLMPRFDEESQKYGYIDVYGKWVIPPKYDMVEGFSEGFAVVSSEGSYGFIDKTGKWVIPPKFSSASRFAEGLALVSTTENGSKITGYIDKAGKFVIIGKPGYSFRTFQNGLALVKVWDKYGWIDKTGNFVIKPRKFYDARSFSEDLALVRQAEKPWKYGYINKNGDWVIKPKFDFAGDFHEGVALVYINNKVGFIDKKGQWIIQPQYDRARSFSEGVASVQLNGKWGVINKSNQWVIPPMEVENIDGFNDGLAVVSMGPYNSGLINKKGDWVWNNLLQVNSFSEGYAWIKEDGLQGFINPNGEWVYKEEIPLSEVYVHLVLEDESLKKQTLTFFGLGKASKVDSDTLRIWDVRFNDKYWWEVNFNAGTKNYKSYFGEITVSGKKRNVSIRLKSDGTYTVEEE